MSTLCVAVVVSTTMAKRRSFLWILLSLTAGLARTQSDLTCPVIGTDQPTSLERSSGQRLFLNFESPSQCRGNVTSYRYCHYDSVGENDPSHFSYQAVLIIYRRNASASNMYIPVPGSIRELSLSRTEANRFQCSTEPVQRFEIQENDVVGACVRDQFSGGVDPLYLVGETTDDSANLKTYQLTTFSQLFCSNTNESVDTGHEDFMQRSNLILHLHANIDASASCRVGSNPPATAPRTNVEGTYLNTDNPVACATENNITSWHYCYYTSPLTAGQTYTMTLAVWRLDTPSNTYRLTAGSARTITLVHVATLAKIFCLEETLSSAERVFVSTDDVIGVVLPSSNPIPVVSSDSSSSSSLMRHPQTDSPTDLASAEFTSISGTALHLYGALEFIEVSDSTTTSSTTSAPPFTTSTPPSDIQQHTTTSDSLNNTNGSPINEDNAKLPSGVYVAIVLSLLALLVLTTIVTILLLIWFNRRKKKADLNEGIANIIYDAATDEVNMYTTSPVDAYAEVEAELYSVPVKESSATDGELSQYSLLEASYDQLSYVDSTQEYAECLKVAKKGITPRIKEDPYHNPASNEAEIYAELRKHKIPNIPSVNIEIFKQLGSGQFGTVHEGTWKRTPSHIVGVAVKTLKDDASITDRVKFLQEAAIMAQFRHPNVVNLHGVAKKRDKIMIVVELLSKGDLFNYLQGLRPDPGELLNASIAHQLLEFSQQITLGMSYLADKGFVHRDLAARNILISDSNICKVADFGMSRDLEDANYYVSSGGKIPLKWTAPEALHYKKYSTASDVWSYGCVLYEIWSVGHKPFENISNVEVLRKLESGFRLPPPPGCPKRVYELMMMCWASVPRDRPGFRDMLLSLLENKSVVLRVPPEDASSHPQAAVLGAPLEAGHGMYIDLQNYYKD